MHVSYGHIDALGRLVIPAAWRRELSADVVLIRYRDEIVIKERREGLVKAREGSVRFSSRELADVDALAARGAMA